MSAAITFGLGGLIPFVALAALSTLAASPDDAFWRALLVQYGALILAFVGALQWGYAVQSAARGAQAWLRYGWSVLPALAAWLSLQLPAAGALQLQAAGLVLAVGVDRALARTVPPPSWLMPLRYVLTAIGASCLLLASVA